MLSLEQLQLLVHLKQYIVADKETCSLFADEYALRPLIRYKYISHHNGIYRLLKKGKGVTGHIEPLMSDSGNADKIERTLKTSRLAATFANMRYRSTGVLRDNSFIPSNKWKEIRRGITSTAKFNGILTYGKTRLAVYDIGDGEMEWQTFAEGSLFFQKYTTNETLMTGMLWICDGDELDIAERILRYTLSNRTKTMKRSKLETDKKWAYSFSPICLKPNYESVYITNRSGIAETLRLAANEKTFLNCFAETLQGATANFNSCDVEAYPTRYFINPQGDLLKFATAYDKVKSMIKHNKKVTNPVYAVPDLKYHIITSKKYERLAKLYDLPLGYTVVDDNLIEEIMEDGTNNEEY